MQNNFGRIKTFSWHIIWNFLCHIWQNFESYWCPLLRTKLIIGYIVEKTLIQVSENKKIHTFCWKLIPRPMIKVNLHNICILSTIIWWLHLWVKSKYLIGILDGGRKCYKYFATVREYLNCMVAQPACWIWNLFWE